MPDHILRYPNIIIDLAIVHLENQADKVGQNSRAPRLGLDGWYSLSSFRTDDWEARAWSVVMEMAYSRCGYVRHNVRSCAELFSVWSLNLHQRLIQYIPFHTERANSAFVALIASHFRLELRSCEFTLEVRSRKVRTGNLLPA